LRPYAVTGTHPGESGIGGVGNKKGTSQVPATGCRGKYFLPMTAGVSKVANYMIALASAHTNHRTTISNCTDHAGLQDWLFYKQNSRNLAF